jgi:hypothetical protein
MELAMVQCPEMDQTASAESSPPTIPQPICAIAVLICARSRWITSRGRKIFAASELDATPASRRASPLAH